MNETHWYEKTHWIYLSLLCPPVCLYALYKNTTWEPKERRKYIGYAAILLVLQIVGMLFGPGPEERNWFGIGPEERSSRQAATESKGSVSSDNAKHNNQFFQKYDSFGAPKILYQCGNDIGYSVGVGMNATYNRLIKDAREECESFSWKKGTFRILKSQQ